MRNSEKERLFIMEGVSLCFENQNYTAFFQKVQLTICASQKKSAETLLNRPQKQFKHFDTPS